MKSMILLATSFAFATPALAQDAPAAATDTTAPAEVTTQDATAPDAVATDDATTTADATAATDATGDTAQTAEAQPAQQPAQQPATSRDQVAQAVKAQFATYDKDANGGLNKSEFSTWMVALRTASDPGFKDGTPEATAWEAQAFTVADADKSASVDTNELTTFLSRAAG